MTTNHPNNDSIIRDFLDENARRLFLQHQRINQIETQIPELRDIKSQMDLAGTALVRAKLSGEPDALDQYQNKINALETRRNELLASHNLAPDALTLTYRCSKCKDTGYINGHPCDCLKAQLAEAAFSRYDLKPLARRENFDTFNLDYYPNLPDEKINPKKYMTNMVRFFKNYCAHFDKVTDNYLFTGAPGLGKTFLSNCIAGRLIHQNKSVVYTTAAHLVKSVRDNLYHKGSDHNGVDQIYETLLDCELLIIDDLGAEYGSDFSGNQLYEMINARLLEDRRMIISTNLTSNQIMTQYDKRLSSRIRGNFRTIQFYGTDIRLLKKK
ncbi:MAG: ATP-binding protein [Eubacteriaceae bacterium]|jgi:DNA replication protein DnaC|nr:ATP-binding protein [Eubacteriaceae bacterium]MDD4507511.1 ATP-binding protein [Eubacteriaceae bacterium]